MADVNVSLYKPLAPPTGGFGQMSPLELLQVVGGVQELQSRQAISDAWRNSIDPTTGNLDTDKLQRLTPLTGYHAPEAVRQGIAAAAEAAALRSGYQQTMRGVFGQLSSLPNATDDDVAAAKVSAAGAGVPPGMIQQFTSTMPSPSNQKAFKSWAVTQSNLARGPEATSAGVTIQGPNGESIQVPEAAAARARAIGGLPTTRIPGVTDADVESRRALVEDQKAAARTLANLRNLDIALPAVEKLGNSNYGPGSPQLASLKASLATAGIIDPNTSDATVRQELNKYLLKYATLAQNSGRSDQALAAAVGSNPNLDLTKPANLALIKNQIGLDRMDASLSKIFKIEHPALEEGSQYNDYKSNYYDRFDRRAFSYDKLSPEERRALVQSLGPKNSAAYKKFNQTFQLAKQAGVLIPEK